MLDYQRVQAACRVGSRPSLLHCGGWHDRHATARVQSPPGTWKQMEFLNNFPCKWGRTRNINPAWPSRKPMKTNWKLVNRVLCMMYFLGISGFTQVGVFYMRTYSRHKCIMFGWFTNSQPLESSSRSNALATFHLVPSCGDVLIAPNTQENSSGFLFFY